MGTCHVARREMGLNSFLETGLENVGMFYRKAFSVYNMFPLPLELPLTLKRIFCGEQSLQGSLQMNSLSFGGSLSPHSWLSQYSNMVSSAPHRYS